jgi:hypothetical protein
MLTNRTDKFVVGPAGFEPTTFTQQSREATVYGFLYDRSRDSSFSSRSQQTRVCLLSGARRHTCLDYDPTVGLVEALSGGAPIKIFMPPPRHRWVAPDKKDFWNLKGLPKIYHTPFFGFLIER